MRCGERVKKVRELMGLTQAEFGERLGFKWDKIKNIETNIQKLTPEIALDIEEKFSFSFRWLLTGKGEMTAGFAEQDGGYMKKSPVIGLIDKILPDLDEHDLKVVLKYIEERKLLAKINLFE